MVNLGSNPVASTTDGRAFICFAVLFCAVFNELIA